ncbi:MAG: hypothetical protein ACLTDM_04220 [Clostridium butyricum]
MELEHNPKTLSTKEESTNVEASVSTLSLDKEEITETPILVKNTTTTESRKSRTLTK